ncbi:N-acetylglucosamine-6-phosphate deacetylase [Alishewanella sp. SMS8]|uniref:N-acetylglucosamine-6-phosphate deacetylase n=1 Tax=Alishewanella sp. SMS8 TaxID=2994676 RepID=UPI002740FF08|nr:N-acetylglucosamine-6-phosphate deacetylase [Alishewanella sp. SMS8]MDP5458175.1 N-acetylglucosamine-6-phosphate deacetylase [Alishewanella sp. SMS8]
MQRLAVAQLFDGANWHHNVEVLLAQGRISQIQAASGQVLAGMLVPGFIDLQVNGGGGALFNTAPTRETLHTMVQAHAQFGTTAMLPTVITDSLNVMQQAATTIADALSQQQAGILGVHFEGPHLSVPKKGVHPQQHIRALTAAELALYQRSDLGCRLLTVAPENVSPEQIQALKASGSHVWLGHSNADAATVQQALQAGANGFTHLYNAMSAFTSRQPGMVGVALTDADSWCGIILDGLHIDAIAAKLALLAKPTGKVVLVTDAMSPVGTTESEFAFFDGIVRREGNKLTNEAGALAGSVLDMSSAVRYAVTTLGVALDEALRMASLYPAQALGIEQQYGRLLPGYRADFTLLNGDLEVEGCWIAGQAHYLNTKH